MIKAEVVTPHSKEAPSWLARSRQVVVNGPALVVFGTLVVVGAAIALWLQHTPTNSKEKGIQSQPAQGQQLHVVTSGVGSQATFGTQTGTGSSTGVGPAPADSLNSLQPTGTTQGAGGQSLGQTGNVQSAGTANQSSLNSSSL